MLASVEGNGRVFITNFVRRLRGGSQPVLVVASDGVQYVVKFAENPQGPNVLFNECVGNELYRLFGLPVPNWRPLWIKEKFIALHPELWIERPCGRFACPNAGQPCYGSRYLGDCGQRIFEFIPDTFFSRLQNRADFWLALLLDFVAGHIDNRQAIFCEDSRRRLHAFFVDHGHMLGGPNGEQKARTPPSMYLDRRIYPDPSEVHEALVRRLQSSDNIGTLLKGIERIPQEWQTKSGLRAFYNCLDVLADRSGLEDTLHHFLYPPNSRDLRDSSTPKSRRFARVVLRTEVFGTGLRPSAIR